MKKTLCELTALTLVLSVSLALYSNDKLLTDLPANAQTDVYDDPFIDFNVDLDHIINADIEPDSETDTDLVFDDSQSDIDFDFGDNYIIDDIVEEMTLGDINSDDTTDIKDVIRLQKYLNDNSVAVGADMVDVNLDKEVNIKDVIRLQKMLNGDS